MSKVRSLLDRFEKTIEANKIAAASTKGNMFLTTVARRSRQIMPNSPEKQHKQQQEIAVTHISLSPPKVPMRALSDATSSTVSLDSEEFSERSIRSSSSRHNTKQQASSKATVTCIRVEESNDEISITEASAAPINGRDDDNNKSCCTEVMKNTAIIEEEKTKDVAVKKKKKTTKQPTEKKTKKIKDPSKPKRKKVTKAKLSSSKKTTKSEADVEALVDEGSIASGTGSIHSVSDRMKRLPREVVFEGDDEDSDSDSDVEGSIASAAASLHSVSERMKRLPREVVFEGDDEDSDSDSD